MTIEDVRKMLADELKRAEADAEMSADEEDLNYHNGEIDALSFVIEKLDKEVN
jgi:hypothetical protein